MFSFGLVTVLRKSENVAAINKEAVRSPLMIKISPVLIIDTSSASIMTSPRFDETQPLLNNRIRREQTPEVVVDETQDESSQPIGQSFRLFGSLLVDSIPGIYMLLLLQLRNLCSCSYSIIFAAKFDSSHYNSDSRETRPGGVVRGVSGIDASFCNWRVPQLIFLYLRII